MPITKKQILDKLKQCYDPEIPINIVDLGLVYDVKIHESNVYIKMTLTSIGCPLYGVISEDVKNKVKTIKGVKNVEVEIVWDPPWTPDKMSKTARAKLGI
ncbi:MAG: metal-sulfur cluster assembly factor [Candidatus Aenigmatarchaeota archaeon]|nr:metal-sulfur cluster assembly factor [Candidatus Aenigmarchaeota archaeon]